ncbi:hypothetical protein [Clostridium sardiniense]|uniref:hypothetical protein n=1 Tax=Clostridium sardiniense TaxID=29369 RepID=UPI00195D6625|nr:hypothetical protein [Clostridium sardiniense]MBM7836470.1 hypothetical protein [Clostridium sardiniense]
MKNSFDLDLNVQKKQQPTSFYTINTLSKLCTITLVGCHNTGGLTTCTGTSRCNTKNECIV